MSVNGNNAEVRKVILLFLFLFQDEKDEEPKGSFKRIMQMSAPEWYFILLGCLGSLVFGGVQPSFAVIFSNIVGVRCVFLFKTLSNILTSSVLQIMSQTISNINTDNFCIQIYMNRNIFIFT